MNALLDIKNLWVSFPASGSSIKIIKNLSFQIFPGEIVGVIGESGSGKSVTALSILRLLSSAEVSGEIWFKKCNLLTLTEREMRTLRGKEMGMIFQDPITALNPTMKIGEQINEVFYFHEKLSRKEASHKTLKLLETVGISDPTRRFNQYPFEFSGGMCQRVMIAMALACKPDLLIADEPTTSLDVTIQAQILELLKNSARKLGTSIMLITHDLGIVAGTCDRAMVMYEGESLEQGSTDAIFYHPMHPYTKSLLKSKTLLCQR